ncbi:zinc finger, CCHC-type containing protein [Tanacetum coccineum]
MGMYISSQNSYDFTTVTINGESEERRTIEGIIQNYYDREDGETTLSFWKPTRKKFTLGEKFTLTRYKQEKAINNGIPTTAKTQSTGDSVQFTTITGRTDHPLVFGLRLLKTYDKGSLTAQEFCEKVHQDSIMGYGDYVIVDSVISRLYYMEGLGYNLFSVGDRVSRSRVLGLNKWYQSLLRDFDLRSITFQTSQSQTEMDPYVTSTPNSTKLPIFDTGKFEQWKFRIQQYLQHEHYALWEVIEFGDSYRAPAQDKSISGKATPSSRSKGRTVAVTAEDMQKRRNDVKARTTLLLALPDEHQLRFSKNDLDTMSLDDLYNHLKVYESEVQKKGGSISQNMAFISSSNTNSGKSEVPTAQSFSTASGQIDDDDIEEMDIKWNMALLSMRVDRFCKKTGKKITIQGSDVARFDKSKVECFNCHKLRHFARECKAPRSQDRIRRESYKKEPKVEEPSHKAMMAIDGIGWDWSFMAEENEASENQALIAEEVVPTEFALMAMSSSSSDNEVEARLVEFKINESKFCEKIRVLERDLELKDYKIENLTNELEEVKKERDGIDSKLEKFVNSSKDLDQMLESQKSGKDKKGVGFDEYRADPPPLAQVYSTPMPDLSWTGLPEFADNTITDYTRPTL